MTDLFSLIAPADRFIVEAFNGYLGQSPRFDCMLHFMSGVAIFKGMPYVAILWWLGARDPDPTFNARWIGGLLVALLFARVLQNYGPAHVRPIVDPALHLNAIAANDHDYFEKLNSFPSDHAVEFFAMSHVIASRRRFFGLIAYPWASLVILLPRIYFGYHYPSDIIGGALIGVATLALALALPPVFFDCARERLAHSAPGLASALAFLAATQIASNFNEIRQVLAALKLA